MKILAGMVEKRVFKRLWAWALCSQGSTVPHGASWTARASFSGRSEEQWEKESLFDNKYQLFWIFSLRVILNTSSQPPFMHSSTTQVNLCKMRSLPLAIRFMIAYCHLTQNGEIQEIHSFLGPFQSPVLHQAPISNPSDLMGDSSCWPLCTLKA